jgi:hypothetical protein
MGSTTPAPAPYPTWDAYFGAVDAALAAGRRPPLWDPDLRWPDQLEAGTTVIRPGGGVPGDERDYLNVVAVSPDPEDELDAVLIADLGGPPVRVYLCDPVEVLTPEAADFHQFLVIDAQDRYATGGRAHRAQS